MMRNVKITNIICIGSSEIAQISYIKSESVFDGLSLLFSRHIKQ